MSEIVISLVVSPIIQEALSKVASFAGTHIKNSWDLKKQLLELEESLIMMQSLLEVAEDMKKSHDAVRNWLQRIEDEAHKLVDLLDEYAYAVHPRKAQVHTFLSLFTSMPSKIEGIRESLDNIRRDASLIDLLRNRAPYNQDPIVETTPYSSDSSEVLGRDNDVSKVVCLLSDLSRQNLLSGLSIVGMPGVGKTALARLIYEKAKEGNLYDRVAWVCLSNNFDEKMILRGMWEYFGDGVSIVCPGAILDRLKSMLEDKRFLLVLDDVWNVDPGSWKKLFKPLLNILKKTGNSILVTTSSEQVAASASEMDAVPMDKYELQKLSDEECRLIMEKKILRSSRITTIPMDLLDIAKQCGGLPLVAAVIGETWSSHTDANEWSAKINNAAWDSPHRVEIVSELKKSFDRLPSPLRKCFSYCSIFPKGFEIKRDEIVQLWLARGLLHQSDDRKSDKEEDVGDKYLNDLVSNYLFQDVEMDQYGNIKSCKMHSQMHNLALFLSKHETYVWPDAHSIEECCSIRHMRIDSNPNFPAIPADVAQRLHSLFLDVDILNNMASNLKKLRSLKLVAAKTKQLGASLDKSKYHIKYLDISKIDIQGLPDTVTRLYNLQTLRVPACQSLKNLPGGIEYLVRLRHIYFDDERHMPRRIGKLTSLQTLPLFFVGTKNGQKIEELKHLNQLRGKLKICNLEQVMSSAEAAKAELERKVNLIKLQFVWSERTANSDNDMDVLKGLQPNSNLKNLTIKNYKGNNFPSWMMKGDSGSDASFQLNSLVKLKLIDCDECENISSLGLLPELKVLTIRAMSNVENIVSNHDRSNVASNSQGGGESIKQFPALRKFKLINMKRLKRWTDVQSKLVFPCLEELHIQDCPELKFYHNRSNMASNSQGGEESITLFPALRKLTLHEMKTLEEWTEVQGMAVFPCLEELYIQHCPELQTWQIDGSISHKLSMLSIQSCENLQVIPDGLLNLKSLDISHCPNLMAYAQGGSRKWSTICHIGSITINGQAVRS